MVVAPPEVVEDLDEAATALLEVLIEVDFEDEAEAVMRPTESTKMDPS